MKFKEGQTYRVVRVDMDSRKSKQSYKAKFYGMSDNLVIFDTGYYKISEIKHNYRKTWKVRSL